MADLPPCKSLAQGGLPNATDNERRDPRQRQPHQPSPEGSIDNNHTPTSTTTRILTPGSSVSSAKLTGVPASEEADGVADRPVGLGGQTIDLWLAGITPDDISAPESSTPGLLVDNDAPCSEIATGSVLIHASRPGSWSFGTEVGPPSAFLALSDSEQDGGRQDYHGQVLMDRYQDDISQNLPYRLLGRNHAGAISEEQRRATIMAGNAAAAELVPVSPPSIYPSTIEETLEELL